MLLQVLVKAKSMEELVSKCNMINLKGGISYEYTNHIYDGTFFYTTYYVNLDSNEVIRKVSELGRRNSSKK